MAREVFVDTSGFYALLVEQDDRHRMADQFLRDAARDGIRFVTTDYVLDETATLLKARAKPHLLPPFFQRLSKSLACRIEWTDADLFASTQAFFLKHLDHAWSFTDCVSFLTMRERKLRESLTKDSHFEEMGFVALLK